MLIVLGGCHMALELEPFVIKRFFMRQDWPLPLKLLRSLPVPTKEQKTSLSWYRRSKEPLGLIVAER
jgi:hypothetical protein